MPVIAITGDLCSGKTTVSRLLRRRGARVFSADRVVHAYYRNANSQIYKNVKRVFPQSLDRRGRILRRRLRGEVFADPAKLRKLERLVHPQVRRDLIEWVKINKGKKGIYIAEIPLLFEKKLDKIFNKVIFVYASRLVLIKRIKRKFGISEKQALQNLELFLSTKEKQKKSDFVINNSFGIENLKKETRMIWQKLKSIRKVREL